MKTEDGCKTINEIELPKEIKKIISIRLIDKNKGYLLSSDGKLIQYNGKDWSDIPLNIKNAEPINKKIDSSSPDSIIYFDNDNEGFVIFRTTKPKSEWLMYITSNGGKKWKKKVLKFPYGPIFISEDGRYLTILNKSNNEIYLYNRK